MNENKSKLIVFSSDVSEKIGDITYVKFLIITLWKMV